MKPFISYLILLTLLTFSVGAGADLTAIANQGKKALSTGNYELARHYFNIGAQQASADQDDEWRTKFLFYQGNTALVEAEKVPALMKPSAQEALVLYKQVLTKRPDSGATMVNFARASGMLDQTDQAHYWYKKAIGLNSKKQAFYRKQYAQFLSEIDPDAAEKQLVRVMRSQPQSMDSHRQLLALYKGPSGAMKLSRYLLKQVDSGEVLAAQRAALDAMADASFPARYKTDLLQVVVASLAKQSITPEEYAVSAVAKELTKLARTDDVLRQGIIELRRTMRKNYQPVDYQWWVKNEERGKRISTLLRSMGRNQKQQEHNDQAESYLRGAVDLKVKQDPKAVLDLVQFYTEVGDLSAINEISTTHEFRLFEGKGDAYRNRDDQQIYDYHRTLASIYAYQAKDTGDWGSVNKANTAAFQLKHAYKTALGSPKITPDTQLVNDLALSVASLEGDDEATELRLSAAAMFTRKGDERSATKVLDPIQTSQLNSAQLRQYQNIRVGNLGNNEITPEPGTNLRNNSNQNLDTNQVLQGPNIGTNHVLQRPNIEINQAPNQVLQGPNTDVNQDRVDPENYQQSNRSTPNVILQQPVTPTDQSDVSQQQMMQVPNILRENQAVEVEGDE